MRPPFPAGTAWSLATSSPPLKRRPVPGGAKIIYFPLVKSTNAGHFVATSARSQHAGNNKIMLLREPLAPLWTGFFDIARGPTILADAATSPSTHSIGMVRLHAYVSRYGRCSQRTSPAHAMSQLRSTLRSRVKLTLTTASLCTRGSEPVRSYRADFKLSPCLIP